MTDHSGRTRRSRGAVTPRERSKNVRASRELGYRASGEGIDTCAVVLRPRSLSALDRLEALPYTGRPDRRLLCRGSGDARLHFFPLFGTVRWEGRAGAILHDDVENHDLTGPESVTAVARAGALVLADLCGELVEETEAARLDIAADLRCSREEGVALLRTLRHVKPPRAKWMLYENPRDLAPETVAFVTTARGRIQFRAYDKGLESGSAARGTWIRLERQFRADRGRRRRPENVDGAYLSAQWSSHLRAMSRNAEAMTVAGPAALAAEIAERVESGDLSPARASSLLGRAYLLPALEERLEERTARRWRADLQAAGIAPVRDDLPDLASVPLPDLLREVAGRFDALQVA